jgi:hypothetical protein
MSADPDVSVVVPTRFRPDLVRRAVRSALVHASRTETFGMTVVEAIATGTQARYGRAAVGARLHEAYAQPGTPSDATVPEPPVPEPPVPAVQRFAARFSSPLPEAVVRAVHRAVRRVSMYRSDSGQPIATPPDRPVVQA